MKMQAVVKRACRTAMNRRVIPTALEQFRFAAEKPAISKACGDLIGSD
jgi:hypothetical protein